MHVKDHTIPLPIRGEPDLYRIRFGGVGYVGPRDECAAVGTALEKAADGIAGDRAVEEFKRAEYAAHWAPKMRGKTVPKYVPAWAVEMHWAEVNDAAA